MTVLTMRRVRDQFVIEPVTFKTRAQARYWCYVHFRGSPIREVGIGSRKKGAPAKAKKGR